MKDTAANSAGQLARELTAKLSKSQTGSLLKASSEREIPVKLDGVCSETGNDGGAKAPRTLRDHFLDASAIAIWITLSVSVILQNKWILHSYGFPYPVTLTMVHMAFGAVVTQVAVRGGWVTVDGTIGDAHAYARCFGPVAALFAVTLWTGNTAYLHLSVPFIQMLKASMPVAVFLSGCWLGTETFKWRLLAAVGVITTGIAVASAGESAFVPVGVAFQLASIVSESFRLGLIQILLKDRKLNPVTTTSVNYRERGAVELARQGRQGRAACECVRLVFSSIASPAQQPPFTSPNPHTPSHRYYLAPAALGCLSLLWALREASTLTNIVFTPQLIAVLLCNAGTAFALNLSIFWLIGRTSALSMNVAGGLKDLLLIGISVVWLGAKTTIISVAGYGVAMAGAVVYKKCK